MTASGRRRAAVAVWHLLGGVSLRCGPLHQEGEITRAGDGWGCGPALGHERRDVFLPDIADQDVDAAFVPATERVGRWSHRIGRRRHLRLLSLAHCTLSLFYPAHQHRVLTVVCAIECRQQLPAFRRELLDGFVAHIAELGVVCVTLCHGWSCAMSALATRVRAELGVGS